jgi:hypothetical protein
MPSMKDRRCCVNRPRALAVNEQMHVQAAGWRRTIGFLVLPIYIVDGLDRYLLVRGGNRAVRSDQQVEATRARWVLEAALRRREPRLLWELSAALHIHGEDLEEVASRLLARLAAAGTIGGDLILVREHPGELPRLDPAIPLEPLPHEPEPPDPIIEEEPEDDPPPAKTTIRVSLFFDGTANNRANTREREADSDIYRDNADEGSFQNDYTNVSRLETLCTGDATFEHSYSIYVEGIGTTNGEGDSLWGMATGMGDTGVTAKVEAGVNELLRGIRELGIARGVIIERIHLDAFGFSRGAAAARNFVHFVLEGDNPLQPRIEGRGYPVEQLEVNFIGLFDTVASHGLNHSNDTEDLSLDAIRAAKKVVQLAAAEEHRKNFRLTDISSAVGAGIGIEIYLPGVHSDIGGGYTALSDEVELQILDFDVLFSTNALERRFERERAWLIESGWYRASEIAEVNFWNELKVTKRGIRNHYNRIPLKHMAKFAAETGLTFDPVSDHHPIPPSLAEVADIVDAHVAAHLGGTTSTAAHWINMRGETFKRLRHDFLHFSAYYGSTMGANAPQWTAGGAMDGRRQRVVQAG